MTQQELDSLNQVKQTPMEKLVDLCENLQTIQERKLAKLDEMIQAVKHTRMIEQKVHLCSRRMVRAARAGNKIEVQGCLMEIRNWRSRITPL